MEKLFVTNDAATIIRELEVEHPAVKMMILGSQMQESEVGDGTNLVIILAGSLLKEAEDLIRMGKKRALFKNTFWSEIARTKSHNNFCMKIFFFSFKENQ